MPSLSKRIRFAVGTALIDILDFIIPHTPMPVLYAGLDIIFVVFSPLLRLFPKVRKTVFTNLDIVLGDSLSEREKRAVARRALRNLLNIPVISVYYAHPKNLPQVLRDVSFEGLDHLEAALAQGKGVIGLGAHLGNFILLNIALSQTDLPFIVVTKEPREQSLKVRYQHWKTTCGITWIDADSRAAATKGILRALKDNHIVHLITDERKKRDGIVVPFFGRPALTAPGPAVLSLRTGAPIVPIFIHERARYKHTIEIFPPLRTERTGDRGRDIYLLTENVNEAVADFIRKYPDQWAWMNPRWKL